MNDNKRLKITVGKLFFLITVFLAAYMLIIEKPHGLDETIDTCYCHVCFQWFIFIIIWFIIFNTKKLDIFEPIVLVSLIHFIFFEITPLICISRNDTLYFGINVWKGCVKGTYISTLGYIILVLLYFRKNLPLNIEDKDNSTINNSDRVLLFNYYVWIFSFLCGLVLIYGYGLNIKYLLTGGLAQLTDATDEKSIYGFLGIFFYAMIPSFLYIFELGKSKTLKIILFYLTFMSYYVRGFRFIMIACIMSPIVFVYLKKHRRPSISTLITMLLGLIVFSSFVQFTRTSLRSGMGAGTTFKEVINLNSVTDVVVDNFEIVKTYYAIVETYPKNVPYTMGAEIFVTTALLMIPSAIWSGKPPAPIYEVVENSLNSYARVAGTSFPYIGEYYFEFGIIGVCVFMGVLGVFLQKLARYMRTYNIHDYIMYASLYPLLFQILIRGYTPTNFYMLFFVFLPVYISKRYVSF